MSSHLQNSITNQNRTMTGKRRRALEDTGPRRTSPRKCAAPVRLGMPSVESLPTLHSLSTNGIDKYTMDFGPLKKMLDQYNSLLSFMPLSAMKVKNVRAGHRQIVETSVAVLRTFEEASLTVNRLASHIQCNIQEAFSPAFGYVRWYQNGNIFDLALEQLREIFRRYPIKDAPDFSEYMFRSSKALLSLQPEAYDHDAGKFMATLRFARQALVDSPHPKGRFVAFHLGIHLLAQILPNMPSTTTCSGSAVRRLHEELLVDTARNLRSPNEYLDCAAARREMLSAYHEFMDCPSKRKFGATENPDSWLRQGGGDMQSHRTYEKHSNFINTLGKAAYGEIRPRVLLAVGRNLPAELAELVFLKSLAAEEVVYRPGMAG